MPEYKTATPSQVLRYPAVGVADESCDIDLLRYAIKWGM